MSFEAFDPKMSWGGTCTPREEWVWLPDDAAEQRLDMFTQRTENYLASLDTSVPHTPENPS